MKQLKQIVVATLVSTIIASNLAFTPLTNGKVILIITVEVNNFTEWKKGFDAGAIVREKARIKVLSVCSSTNTKNEIIVIEEAENAQSAHDFLQLLKSKQKEGDLSKLQIKMFDKVE